LERGNQHRLRLAGSQRRSNSHRKHATSSRPRRMAYLRNACAIKRSNPPNPPVSRS
jgi:hypothetical protein